MAEGRSFTTTFKTKAETQGISEMQKKLQDLQKSLRDNQTEQKSLSKEIRDAEKEIKQIEKTIAKTGTTTEEQRKRLEQLKATITADRENIEKLKLQEAQLRSEMEATNRQIEAERKALDDLKTSMGDAKSAAGELTKEVAAIGAAATAAVAGLFAFTKEAAQWADDINTLSKTTGISTAELQKFTYATNLIDVSVDTLSGSLTKLTRNMSTAAENGKSSAAEAFKELHVAVTDAAGELRDRQEVFYDVINALGKIANETQRDALAMDIFGKSAQQLNPLIKGGAEALKEIGAEAEKAGLILSQDTLNSLNAFNDKVDELKAKGTAIKELAAAEMTPALDGLVEVGDELLQEIQQMVKSGELKSMAKELGVAIKNGAEALKNIIGFVWKYKEAIGAAVVGMVAFKAAMSITALINSLVVGFKALRVATQSETTSMAALNAVMNANPIGIVVGAVAALTAAFITLTGTIGASGSAFRNYNEELDELLKKQSEAEANAAAEGAEVQLLKDEYDRLRQETNLTAREKERLNTVCEELAGKLGITTDELKTQEGAYRDLTGEVDKYIKKLQEQAKYDYYESIIKESAKAAAQIESDLEAAEKARQAWLDGDMETYRELVKILRDQGHTMMEDSWGGFVAVDVLIDQLNDQLDKAHDAADRATEAYRQLGDAASKSGSALGVLAGDFEGGTKTLEDYAETLADAEKKLEELSKEAKTLQSQSTSLRSEMNSLASSMKQLENGEALSLNTLLDLIEKYPEYAAELIAARDNVDLQRAALEHLFEAKKNDYILTQQAAIENIRASQDETKVRLENIQLQIGAYEKLGGVMTAVGALGGILSYTMQSMSLQMDIDKLDQQIADYEKKIEFVKTLKIGDFGTTSGGSGTTKKDKDTEKKNTLTAPHTWNYKGETYTTEYSYTEGEFDAEKDADASAKAYLGVLDRAKALGKLTLGEEISNLQSLLKWEKISADQRYDIRLRLYKAQEQLAKQNADAENKAADEANKALLERQNLALAAYNRLADGKIEALEAESKAAQDSADKQIAALDAVMKKRKEESEDAKRQKELDQINAKLRYQQLDEFERMSLERRRQDILNEQADVAFERRIENQKAAITGTADAIQSKNAQAIAGLNASKTQAADRVAYLQGSQTYDQRVKNNTTTQNVTIVQNGLSGDQLINKLLKELGAI